jgi:type I restriction enzyme S subunit
MDAQRFLAEFSHIANAPGGIERLRELVFSLAAEGLLFDDCELIELSHLNKVADFIMGQAPPGAECNTNEHGTVFVKTGEFGELYPIVREWTTKPLKLAKLGDVLICVVGATVGKLNLAIDCAIGRSVAAIRPHNGLDTKYLYYMLMPFTLRLRSGSRGSAQGVIGKAELSAVTLRVPSEEEQSRIVAKVDELMALCDKLEAQQQERRKLQNNLRLSTLQAVANANSPHELQTAWTRLAENFGQLFHAPEDVDQFVAELKNVAVRGLLSLSCPSAPAVDVIMADCEELRSQYIQSGLMRRQKIISTTETEVTYPDHWEITPFDKVAIVIGGVTKGRDLRGRNVVTCPYLAVANVQRGFFKLDNLKSIQIGAEELNKYLVEEGDLLITEGGDWDKVGRTAIWRGGIENCLHQNHVFKARIPSDKLLNEWVELVFNSGVGRDYFAGASKQTTNLASINMTQLRSFPLPIPPLAEQIDILEKLKLLTEVCHSWRHQLQRKQDLASLLATASTASFAGNVVQQATEPPAQLPQTEITL